MSFHICVVYFIGRENYIFCGKHGSLYYDHGSSNLSLCANLKAITNTAVLSVSKTMPPDKSA